MKVISSVKYNKRTGEYLIKRKDVSGRYSITFANRLTEEEKVFCRNCKGRNESPYEIQWH